MNLQEYRQRKTMAHQESWSLGRKQISRCVEKGNEYPDGIRGMNMLGWYSSTLVLGPFIMNSMYDIVSSSFGEQCNQEPEEDKIGTGEIVLSGHANLLACCGYPDFTSCFKSRLTFVRTKRNGAAPAWHHGKLLAAIALREPIVYWGPLGVGVAFGRPIPFTPGELHGFNPQSLLRHLAAGMESGASISDVWPAFRECVFNFPVKDESGDFDGSCLFWIARIVHHHIGRQPLGETAAWLHRHFDAWADGDDLPPLGALAAV